MSNLKTKMQLHDHGQVKSTSPHLSWKLIWYGAFESEKKASDFERYLKSGSGKSFAYKRLIF